jgi:hypothetical protein
MADGVKKISELVVKDGRAIIITDDAGALNQANVPSGTLFVNTSTGEVKVKLDANASDWSKLSPTGVFIDKSVPTSLMADAAITEAKLSGDGASQIPAVSTVKIKDAAVTSPKIADSAVGELKIATDAVTTTKIKDANVTTPKIADENVTEEKLADGAVTNMKYAAKSISYDKIVDGTLVNQNFHDDTIDNAKLADKTIDSTKVKDGGLVTSVYADKSVTGAKIADKTIAGGNVADGTLTSDKLFKSTDVSGVVSGAVISDVISDKAVISRTIGDKAVITRNLDDGAVATDKIADGAVTEGKLNTDFSTKIDISLRPATLTAPITVPYMTSGNPQTGEKWVSSDNLYVNGKIIATGDIIGARVMNPVAADFAEAFNPGEKLEVGDIVEMHNDGKIYMAHDGGCIVGVVSDRYGICFGTTKEEIEDGSKVAVALLGQVPVKVTGEIRLGDRIAVANNGVGCSDNSAMVHIGKALENKTLEEDKMVLCLVFPS